MTKREVRRVGKEVGSCVMGAIGRCSLPWLQFTFVYFELAYIKICQAEKFEGRHPPLLKNLDPPQAPLFNICIPFYHLIPSNIQGKIIALANHRHIILSINFFFFSPRHFIWKELS